MADVPTFPPLPESDTVTQPRPIAATTPTAGLRLAVSFALFAGLAIGGCNGLPAPEPATGPMPLAPIVEPEDLKVRIDGAEAAAESGDYDAALATFQRILAENPTVTRAYMGVGDIRLELGQPELAEPAFRRAARLEPRSFDAQYKHGIALSLLGRIRDAVLAFQRAVTIDPEDFEANRDLSTALLELGRLDAAADFGRKAVALRPDDGPARLNLGTITSRQGDDAAAIEQYVAALELMGNDPRILTNLVFALSAERRYREAVNTANELVRVEATADVYERLGWCHFKLREYEASREAYQAAIEIDPNHWPSLNGIGVNALNAWLISERKDAAERRIARDAFRASLKANPEQQRVINLLIDYQL